MLPSACRRYKNIARVCSLLPDAVRPYDSQFCLRVRWRFRQALVKRTGTTLFLTLFRTYHT